jgi:hypothetical protein
VRGGGEHKALKIERSDEAEAKFEKLYIKRGKEA